MAEPAKRILIIKPSSLGDIVHTLPLAHGLKRCIPGCQLSWVVQDSFAGLLERDPAVDRVYAIHISSTSDPAAGRFAYLRALQETRTSLKQLRQRLQPEPYDLVLDLHASFRSGLLGRMNPGGLRLGFKDARELNTFFQHQLVAVPDTVQHALDKNLLFADHLHCTTAAEDFHICSSREDAEAVHNFLLEQDLAAEQPIIYANPAARWQTKFWAAEKWAALADRFRAANRAMVFGGSRGDLAYIHEITSMMQSQPFVAAGRFSLPESVALLKRASLYVGLDSGPMHMAAMAGIPVVALFGPTHPDRVGPYRVDHCLVRAEHLECLECRKRTCTHHSCMEQISVDMVYDAAIQLLS
jgi:ADP-heptose:LPS heptosyltransferase